ncbi:MAG: magnesium chelatase subunit D [Pararhodobacter sp.]
MSPFDLNRQKREPDPWTRVERALALFMVDPVGLGGLWLRGRAGPVRDAVLSTLASLSPVRLHRAMDAAALEGATDLTATLAEGRLVRQPGLLAQGGVFLLAMAESCPPALAGRLAQRLDAGGAALIALDEGAEDDPALPRALTDRLGLFLDLDGLVWSETGMPDLPMDAVIRAQARLPSVAGAGVEALTRAAAGLGIDSLRAPLLALACARAQAALRGAEALGEEDLAVAAGLVLAHRATQAPEDDTPPPPAPEPETDDTPAPPSSDNPEPLEDRLIEAARTALPTDLLERLAAGRAQRANSAGGTGGTRAANRRGRPLPSRPGRPGTGARVDLVATLRNAAPWQPLRRSWLGEARPVVVLPSDLRIRRFRTCSDRVLIFAVDASGSQAMARLAEVKGAVELLLARAYSRRDHVALIAFRGTKADEMLAPTRSIVQTKRRLAGLPGGGGTPLAIGLQAALACAERARAHGLSPSLVLLTDGKANIGLTGAPGRPQAQADALAMAARLARAGLPSVAIDTGILPSAPLAQLAAAMGARLLSLPRADSAGMSRAVTAALGGP